MAEMDWQRDEVYHWEWKWKQWRLRTHKTVKGTKVWVDWACKRYDVEAPKVASAKLIDKEETMGVYDSDKHKITIRTSNLSIPIALHEAAHAIAYKLHGKMDHGKLWLGIYIDLMVAANMAPRVALEASADDEGLKYLKNANPKRVRKYLKNKKARKTRA